MSSALLRRHERIGEEGERLFKMAAELGLEGIVAKRLLQLTPRGA